MALTCNLAIIFLSNARPLTDIAGCTRHKICRSFGRKRTTRSASFHQFFHRTSDADAHFPRTFSSDRNFRAARKDEIKKKRGCRVRAANIANQHFDPIGTREYSNPFFSSAQQVYQLGFAVSYLPIFSLLFISSNFYNETFTAHNFLIHPCK